MSVGAASLTDFWIDYFVGWGGIAGFTVGMIGAAVAVGLRLAGYRRVSEVPETHGWSAGLNVGPLPNPLAWFGLWSFLGSVVGAAAGTVFWLES